MSGTKAGGLKGKATILARDPDFYKRIGAKGGKTGAQGQGFTSMSSERVQELGRMGGTISRKGKRSSAHDYAGYKKRVQQYAKRHQDDV